MGEQGKVGEIAGGRTRNPRGAGSGLRDEVVAAGIRLVDRSGNPGALSLRGVAREAGVSAPAIYPHFSDLAAVREAVLEASFHELAADVRRATDERNGDAEQALTAGAEAYVGFGWAHRARYRLMFAAEGFAPNAVDAFALVERLLQECVDQGRSTSRDPHADAILLWFALHGVATLQKPSREDYLRLGPIDRSRAVRVLVHRLAQLTSTEPT